MRGAEPVALLGLVLRCRYAPAGKLGVIFSIRQFWRDLNCSAPLRLNRSDLDAFARQSYAANVL